MHVAASLGFHYKGDRVDIWLLRTTPYNFGRESQVIPLSILSQVNCTLEAIILLSQADAGRYNLD